MGKCNFSKKYLPLLQYYSTAYKAAIGNEEEQKAIKNKFVSKFNTNSLAGIDEYFSQSGKDPGDYGRQETFSDSKDKESWRTIVDVPTIGLDTTNLTQFLGGNTIDTTVAINEFVKTITQSTILSIENGKVILPDVSGEDPITKVSKLTTKLNDYKVRLINEALDDDEIKATLEVTELPEMTYAALKENGQFDILLQTAVGKRGEMTAQQRKAVAFLNNFDALLLDKCKFIGIKNQYRNNPLSTADKYEWKGPNVETYSGWGDKKEYTDAMSQTSDFAKAILDCLPVYKNTRLDGVTTYEDNLFVGVGGFYNAMLAMSQWYKESCPNGNKPQEFIDEFNKGTKGDIVKLINFYIQFLDKRKADDLNTDLGRTITSLKNELYSIRNLIFDGNLANTAMVNIFKKMVYSSTMLNYTAYGRPLGETEISRIGLKQVLLNSHLYNLKNAITSAIYKNRLNVADGEKVKPVQQIGNYTLKGSVDNNGNVTAITIEGNGRAIKIPFTAAKYNDKSPVEKVAGKDELTVIEDLIPLMKDVCGIMLPDVFYDTCQSMGYNDSIDVKDSRLKKMLYNCIVPVIRFGVFKQAFPTNYFSAYSRDNNFPSGFTKSFYDMIRDMASVQSRIMGDVNKSVIYGVDGKTSLPSYGLTNEGSRIQELARKLASNESNADSFRLKNGHVNPFENNILITRDGAGEVLYSHIENRSSILVGKKMTPISKATVKDCLKAEIEYEFLQRIGKAPTIGIQTATHADKSVQGIHHFNMAYKIWQNTTLQEAINEVVTNSDALKKDPCSSTLMQATFARRSARYQAILKNLIQDYNNAFGWGVDTIDQLIDKIEEIKGKKGDVIATKFAAKHIDFDPTIHYGKAGFNLTLYNGIKTYTSGNAKSPKIDMTQEFKNRIDLQRRRFARSLLKARVKLSVGTMVYKNGVPMKLLDFNDVYDGNITLDPKLEAYFQSHILLGGELNAVELGEVYAHPGSGDVKGWEKIRFSEEDKEKLHKWSQLDESVRLIAQIKRTVIPGATMHTLVQGLDNGVNPTMHLAVMKDVEGYVQNILGRKDHGAKSSDGSALSFALHGRLENNSLQDARAGVDRKTIGHGMYKDLCGPELLKFATFDITNTRRQAAFGSDVDLEVLYKKMANYKSFAEAGEEITKEDIVNLYKDWGQYTADDGFKKKLYKQDPMTLQYYRLDVTDNDDLVWTLVNEKGEDQPADKLHVDTTVDNWYDVDQLFGGCWAMTLVGENDDAKLIFSEANIDLMEMLATRRTALKDCYIAMAVNASAIKVGGKNVNSSNAWHDKNGLTTFDMSTEFYGLQMDAEHEVTEHSDVSEMTQMISAFIENGFSKNVVNEVYNDIGECIEEALKDCIDALNQPTDEEKRKKISVILGEAYIKSMEGKDTIGLAQAFIQRAQQGLKRANLLDGIPVSAASISDSFMSTVANMITKKGIKRKYAGFAGVQTPSYDMIQYYNISGGTGLYRHFAAEALAELKASRPDIDITKGYDILEQNVKFAEDWDNPMTLEDFLNSDIIAKKHPEESLADLNGIPLPKAMARGGAILGTKYREKVNIEAPDVNMEDTVTWLDSNGIAHSMRFCKFEDLDGFKDACSDGLVQAAFKNLAAPHNLRGRTITLTDELGHKYNHFDIESVRAAYIYNNLDLATLTAGQLFALQTTLLDVLDVQSHPDDAPYINMIDDLTDEAITQAYATEDIPALVLAAYNDKARKWVTKLLERKVQSDLRKIKQGKDIELRTGWHSIVEHHNLPGEIITGRVGSAKFGLSRDVDLNTIKSAQSFKSAIKNSGEKISGDHGCDTSVMMPTGEPLLFKVCNPTPNKDDKDLEYTLWMDKKQGIIQDAPAGRFEVINGKVYQGDTVILSGVPANVNLEFKQFIDKGIAKDIIVVKPILNSATGGFKNGFDVLDSFLKSRKVDLVRYYWTANNSTWIGSRGFDTSNKKAFEEDENKKFAQFIDNEAVRRYESFELAKNYAATRIPAQGMQSFMHVKTVGITDSEVNELYIPIEKMYDDGSDYDIDKGYLMGYAVEQGKIVVNSNLYSGGYNYTLNDCFNLANPTGQSCTHNQSITENTYFLTPKDLAVFTQELTSEKDHPSTIELFNKIIRSGAMNISLDDKALSLAKENGDIAEEIAKQIDKHNTTQLSPDMLDLAIKNKTLFKILQVTDDIENLPIASTSVDTVTKEPKGIANKTDAAEEKKILCYDNPASIFEMQITNMVGKEVIGIAAVSLKSFFAESAYYNQIVTEIEDIVKQNPYDSTKNDLLVKKLNQLLIPNALEGGTCSLLANVNYNDLYELLQERDILLSEGEVALDKIFYNPLTGGSIDWLPNENGMYSVKNLIQIYKFIADVNDACYSDSGLLSLATDFLR